MGTSFVTDATGLRVQPLEICLAHLSAFLMTDLGYPWVEKNSDILLHYRRKSSSSEQSSQTEVLRVWNAYFCDRPLVAFKKDWNLHDILVHSNLFSHANSTPGSPAPLKGARHAPTCMLAPPLEVPMVTCL